MIVLLGFLLAVGLIALLAGYVRNKNIEKKIESGELDEYPEVTEVDTDCCGQHELCEKDSLLAAVSQKVEYYDDEELDQFIGYEPTQYNGDEAEMFRDVFYTMHDTEVAGWVRSLTLRGINLPEMVKDEVLLIVGERRIH